MIQNKTKIIQKQYRNIYLKKMTEFEAEYDKILENYLNKTRKILFDISTGSGEIKSSSRYKVKKSIKRINNWLTVETEDILEMYLIKSIKIAVLGQLKALHYYQKLLKKNNINIKKYNNLHNIENKYNKEKTEKIKNIIWNRQWEDNLNINNRLEKLNKLNNRKTDEIINKEFQTVDTFNKIQTWMTKPEGLSNRFNVLRLARTETNSGYRFVQKNIGKDSNLVKGIKWNLSKSHPDYGYYEICEKYAGEDHSGLGVGVYKPENLPEIPHPGCLCYLIYIYKEFNKKT